GIAYALTTALHSEITVENGQVQQSNFHDYPILKLDRMPAVTIEILPSTEPPASIGEDAVPVTIAALVNAIADAAARVCALCPLPKSWRVDG
ncbi:xanthine dehydrogenase family protein molybdopterin-binding subunit, partial [Shewanella indica]